MGVFDDLLVSNRPSYGYRYSISDNKDEEQEQSKNNSVWDALRGGFQSTGRSLGAAADVVQGDNQEVLDAAKVAPDMSEQQMAFREANDRYEKELGDDSTWQVIKNVANATWDHPLGAFHEIVSQLPNTGVIVGSMMAGAKAGGMAGAALGSFAPGPGTAIGGTIGTFAGGITGMFVGNSAIETGSIALDKASDGTFTDEESSKSLSQGMTKGGVITLFDVATMGASKFVLGAPGRAVEKAIAKIVADEGLDITNNAAVKTAFASNQALRQKAVDASAKAFESATGIKPRIGMGATTLALESYGEGAGEYYGSLAAGLDASLTDAVLESMMSIPQSATELHVAKELNNPGRLTGLLGQANQNQSSQNTPPPRVTPPPSTPPSQQAISQVASQAGAQARAQTAQQGGNEIDQTLSQSNAILKTTLDLTDQYKYQNDLVSGSMQQANEELGLEGEVIENEPANLGYMKLEDGRFIDNRGNIYDEIPKTPLNAEIAMIRQRQQMRLENQQQEQKPIQLGQDQAYPDPIQLGPDRDEGVDQKWINRREYFKSRYENGEGEAQLIKDLGLTATPNDIADTLDEALARGQDPEPILKEKFGSISKFIQNEIAKEDAQGNQWPELKGPKQEARNVNSPEAKAFEIYEEENPKDSLKIRNGQMPDKFLEKLASALGEVKGYEGWKGANVDAVIESIAKDPQRWFNSFSEYLNKGETQPIVLNPKLEGNAANEDVDPSKIWLNLKSYDKKESEDNFNSISKSITLTDSQKEVIREYNDDNLKNPISLEKELGEKLLKSVEESKTAKEITLYRSDHLEHGFEQRANDSSRVLPLTTDPTWANAWSGNLGEAELSTIIIKPGVSVLPINEGNTGESEVLLGTKNIEIKKVSSKELTEEENEKLTGSPYPVKHSIYVVMPKSEITQPVNAETTPKTEITQQTVSETQAEPELTVMSNGKPYSTMAMARKAAETKGLKDYKVVSHGSGFAIKSNDGQMTQSTEKDTPIEEQSNNKAPESNDYAIVDSLEDIEALPKYAIYESPSGRFMIRGDGPRGGGDTIHETLEEAKKEAEFQKDKDEANEKFWAEQDKKNKEQEAIERAEKAEREDIDGFAEDLTKLQRSRVVGVLNKKVMRNGKLVTRKQMIRDAVNDGYTIGQFNGKRTLEKDGSFLDEGATTKTGMDYAEHLLAQNQNKVSDKPESQAIKDYIEGKRDDVPTTEEVEQEQTQVIDNELEGSNIKLKETGGREDDRTIDSESDQSESSGSRQVREDGQGRIREGNEGVSGDGADREGNVDDGRERSIGGSERGNQDNTQAPSFFLDTVEDIANGTDKQRVDANLEAIRLMKRITSEKRPATQSEKEILAKYVGWGGLSFVFDSSTNRKYAQDAEKELRKLLTRTEYNRILESTRNAFYTSKDVVKAMWKGVKYFGLGDNRMNVLEPSVGSGNFIGWQPEEMRNNSNWSAAELDTVTGNIARLIYHDANVQVRGFEEAPFKEGVFTLAIGNPPFGSQPIHDKKHDDISGMSVHNYMIAKSAKLLHENGLLMMVVTNRFLDTLNKNHRQLSNIVDFVGAVRLPNTAFKSNAGTEVTTDIVVFRKLKKGETATNTVWTEVNGDLNGVKLNKYFESHPQNILGRPSMDGTMYGGREELTVHPTEEHSDLQNSISLALKDMAKDFDLSLSNKDKDMLAGEVMLSESDLPVGGMMINEEGKILFREDDNELGANIVEITPNTPWTANGELLDRILRRFDDGNELRRIYQTELVTEKGGLKSNLNAKPFQAIRDYLNGNISSSEAKASIKKGVEGSYLNNFRKNGYRKLKQILEIRNTALALIRAEKQDLPDIEQIRARLNNQYDAFVSEHSAKNKKEVIDNNLFLLRGDLGIESGLDSIDKKGNVRKHDIFNKRMIMPYEKPDKANNVDDAVNYSIQEKGRVDIGYIAELLGVSRIEAKGELTKGDKPYLLLDPNENEYVFIDDYLSGNVKAKYKAAQEAGLEKNVALLKSVLPKDKPADKVKPSIRSTWIDKDIYEQFLDDLGIKAVVNIIPTIGSIRVASHAKRSTTELGNQFKNNHKTIVEIFEAAAAGKSLAVYKEDIQGNLYKDTEATKQVTVLVNKMSETFKTWVESNKEARQRIADNFNERINTHIERKFNGRMYFKPAGQNPEVDMRKTQLDGALRMVQSKNVLLDHTVGAGKTFTAISGVMQRRRLGLSKKPLIVVPNHIIGAFTSDFYTLYPGAKVLTATEKQMSAKNRKQFFSRIATGDYDAVIIGHSHLRQLPNNMDNFESVINEKVDELKKALEEAKKLAKESGRRGSSTKQIADQIARLQDKIKAKKQALEEKQDSIGFDFGDLGVDYLVIDEAHEFKNLTYSTSGDRVVGMNDPKGSEKALDLLIKVRSIQGVDNGGVTFMTGTPVSNSLVELYTMMYYLGYNDMKEGNLSHYDAFAGSFINTESALEYTATGTVKERTILKGLSNMQELATKYRQFADVITRQNMVDIYAEDVEASNKKNNEFKSTKFPIPKVKGSNRQLNIAPATPRQTEYNDYLIARMEAMNGLSRQERLEYARIDNPLWVLSDAKKASLDIRLVDPKSERDQTGKIARASKEINRIYKQWSKDKGAQLVFSDMGPPAKYSQKNIKKELRDLASIIMAENKTKTYVEGRLSFYSEDKHTNTLNELIEKIDYAQENGDIDADQYDKAQDLIFDLKSSALTADTGFSVYDDLKAALIEQGIPEEEIAFIHDYNTSDKKKELFDRVNGGDIRVLIGSSKKMGAGTNVQERLVALHHMDAPWRPSDMEQREGRIIRQGNSLYERDPDKFEVEIIAYATQGSSDPVMWQILERKAKAIEQFRAGGIDEYVEDSQSDGDSYAEFKASSTGNPIYREKLKSDGELVRLQTEYTAASSSKSSAERVLEEFDEKEKRYNRIIEATESFSIDKYSIEDFEATIEAANKKYEAALDRFDKRVEEYNNMLDVERKEVKKPTKPSRTPFYKLDGQYAKAINENVVIPATKAMNDKEQHFEIDFQLGKDSRIEIDIDKIKDGYNVNVRYIKSGIRVGGDSFYGLSTFTGSSRLTDAISLSRINEVVRRNLAEANRELSEAKKLKQESIPIAKKSLSKEQKAFRQEEEVNDWLSVEVKIADIKEDIRRGKRPNTFIDNEKRRNVNRSTFDVNRISRETLWFEGTTYSSIGLKLKYGGWEYEWTIPAIDQATGEYVHLYAKNKGKTGNKVEVLHVAKKPDGVSKTDIEFLEIPKATKVKSFENLDPALQRMDPVRYSLSDNPKGISEASAKLATNKIAREIGVKNEVIKTAEGLPERLYLQVKKDGVENRVRGLFDAETGKAYIIASNLNSPKEAVEVFLHEVVGHKGIRSVLGNKLNVVLSQIYSNIPADIRSELESEYAGQLEGKSQVEQKRIIADEYIALLAQTDPKNTLLDKVIAVVRSWLRKFGKNLEWTRGDIVELLAQSKRALKDNQNYKKSVELRYSKDNNEDDEEIVLGLPDGGDPLYDSRDYEERESNPSYLSRKKDAESIFLSYLQKGGLDFGYRSSDGASGRSIKSASAATQRRIQGNALDEIASTESLGPFTGYQSTASIKRGVDGRPELHIRYYGNEQIDNGFDDTPALTFVFDRDNELVVYGPAKSSKSYKEMERLGWVEDAKDKDGNIQQGGIDGQGWTKLKGVGLRQNNRILGEVHARALTWSGEEFIGMHWQRMTGATGGIDGRRSALLFSLKSDALDKLNLNPKQKTKLADIINQASAKENEDSWWSFFKHRANEGLLDGLVGIKRAEDKVGTPNPEDSGYIGARLATGVADVMSAVLQYGAPEWHNGVLRHKAGTNGLLDILGDLGNDLTDFLGWVAGNRANELYNDDEKLNRENNLTRDEIDELLSLNKGKEAKFDKAHREYVKLNKAMLDMAEESGLIDPNSRNKWESEWYIPFYREAEEGSLLAPRTSKGLSHQTAGIRRLKGGEDKTNDLLENILTNWVKMVDSSMKNSALLKTVNNLKGSEYLENETYKFTRVIVPKSQIKKQIRDDEAYRDSMAYFLGVQGDDIYDAIDNLDAEGMEAMFGLTEPKDKDVIRVKRNGKSEFYKVKDPALLRAVTHLNSSGFNDPITRAGRYLKRLLTTGVTASPDFMLRNFIRDAVHGWAINSDGFKLGVDSFKGLKNALKEDDDYKALMFAGGSFQGGYVHGTDPEASAEIIRRALEKKGLSPHAIRQYQNSLLDTPYKLKDALARGWQKYRTFGDKVENANRLSTYKAAKAAGKSDIQAAFEAKDMMDYSLRGNFIMLQYLTDLVPFMNARLQGLSKLGRAAKENPKRVLMDAGVKLAVFSIAIAMLNDDEDEYKKLPDWDKDANWHFFIGGEHFRLPKPFEIGIMFGTVPERMTHVLMGSQDSEKLAWSIKHNLFHTLAFNPTPQFAMPLIESVANRQFFFDRPIEGMADEGKITQARYDERTSSTMRILSDWMKVLPDGMELSPKKLEHLLNGYTGTLGMYALGMADLGADVILGRPDRPTKALKDYPLLKVIYQGDSARSVQYTTDVYDRMKEVEEIFRTIRAYKDEGLKDKAKELYMDNKDKLRYRKALGKARKQLGEIRKEMNRIERHRVMSADVKRRKLDELTERRNKIAQKYAELTEDAF